MTFSAAWLGDAMHDVANERARQVNQEGWTPQHDDSHTPGTLAQAAACYAVNASGWVIRGYGTAPYWPFDEEWWKPKDKRRDLVRAAALIVAEIERIDRANAEIITDAADAEARLRGFPSSGGADHG
jgi:hypothetical protein